MPIIRKDIVRHSTWGAQQNAQDLLVNKIGHRETQLLNDILYTDYNDITKVKKLKKDCDKLPGIFRRCILLHLIMASEDCPLKWYIKTYKSKRLDRDIRINTKWLKQYVVGCSCDDCYGKCLEIASRCNLLY